MVNADFVKLKNIKSSLKSAFQVDIIISVLNFFICQGDFQNLPLFVIKFKIVSIKKGRSLVFRSLIVLTNLVHKYKIIKCILQNNNLKNMASQGAHQEYGLNYGQILTEAIKSLNHQEDEETILPPILTT